jgi:hypothetical protein
MLDQQWHDLCRTHEELRDRNIIAGLCQRLD